MRVLILSVSAGKGHSKAAEAIKGYFDKNFKDVYVEVIDTLKYINPIVDKLVVGSYLKFLSTKPSIYAKLYEYAESDDSSIYDFSNFVNEFLSIKINNLFEKFKPDVILCTHPFPLEMISILKKKGKASIPTASILTDYAPHPFWFYDRIEAYVIPHEDFIPDLIDFGISRDIIYPYGIPVCESFTKPLNKKEMRRNLGLDENKATLLLMGGGLGIGNMKYIFESLAFSSLDIQMIACSGSNEKLKNQLTDISRRSSKKTLIFDYTDKISELMSAADMLITKPGGLTITEALIKGLPIIITSAIPGQEERNADYLLNNGIAARVRKNQNIVPIITQLIQSPSRLRHMSESAREKAKFNATKDICNLLINMAENHQKVIGIDS